ncbi:hypothetical protein ACFYYB_26975 [Streptomyces sp. NPDC002886]
MERAAAARVWRAFAQMLRFSDQHHVPQPVHPDAALAENFAVTMELRPW